MGSFINQPTVPIMYLRPTRASFDVIGNSIDGGTNSTGESISIEIGGGGRVTATYERCVLQGDDTERHEVINWLGARMNGGFRFANVPIINDGIGPFPIMSGKRRPFVAAVPKANGTLFDVGTTYSEATVYAVITANAVVGAGVIQMQVFGAERPLRWSDWFSIYHPTKGWRAYRYWEVQSVSADANPIYTLAIGPALREAITVGTKVELAQPQCVMKFPKGFTLPWDYEAWYQSRPTLQFTEAM
ncbi:hypothetical protein G6M04_14355 [Agrobacterium rhizogenes]|uniref:hypothetical protein n=1 Tax=Rhizobium rhizogenes TaxID=359 RepID=UPI001572BA13|nr:hypothetical protein [Rhizobium rhizogenes]NTG48571.1 hypothetical protein [Rhizobium rhizogenes]